MTKTRVFSGLAALVLGLIFQPSSISAQSGVPELIRQAARNQDVSLAARDRARYEQSINVIKYKPASKPGEAEKIESERDTVVLVEPSATPDETGNYPVNVRVIQDAEKGKGTKKVDPNARTLLSFGVVWDAAFFPLLPEKIEHYTYDEIVSNKPNEKIFRFRPKATVPPDLVLASGTVHIDPKKGHVLTIKIDGLKNLGALDKRLNDINSFTAITDYSEFEGKFRFPTFSKGVVVSDVTRFKGNFRYTFEEGKYIQVLAEAR